MAMQIAFCEAGTESASTVEMYVDLQREETKMT
jgi:hypothetical protein